MNNLSTVSCSIEDFKHQNKVEFVAQLSSEERVQLFELLYKPSTSSKKARENSQAKEKDATCNTPLEIVRQRLIWLLVLLVANATTAAVISSQEDVLQQVVVLASFIPLLIASAGNVSTQAATVVVRALHSGQTKLSDLRKVLCQEMIAGLLLGAVLGLLVAGIALLLQTSPVVALVVGLSLVTISVIATLCGAMLPFCFQLLGFDPALMSAPFSATVVDIAGILVYMGVARLILHI